MIPIPTPIPLELIPIPIPASRDSDSDSSKPGFINDSDYDSGIICNSGLHVWIMKLIVLPHVAQKSAEFIFLHQINCILAVYTTDFLS